MAIVKQASKPKRLTPKPEVLRELYLLSGNNCAIPDCDHVIIDHAGVVVGHVCHIEAALPDGARFNEAQTNDERRAPDNLVLLCAGHHKQIDSKKHESLWNVQKLKMIKAAHEKKFKGLDDSLQQAFQNSYVDSTDRLTSTSATSFAELERLLPDCKLHRPSDASKRLKQVNGFVKKLGNVPDDERKFMASVIRRAMKLDLHDGAICVHVDDVRSAFKISPTKIKSLGDALDRYGVGSVGLAGSVSGEDEWHVILRDPSEYVTWADIFQFCDISGRDLDDFVLRLKFGILDSV